MKKKDLTSKSLINEALLFCKANSGVYISDLFGVTDGKAIGTYVERQFKDFLNAKYNMESGNAAYGLDLPSVNVDIKVTSIRQPQSSCPFKDSRQKIFGLGYNLLVFVYKKHDDARQRKGMLEFVSCTYIDQVRTADYQTTRGIADLLSNDANQDDIFAFLMDHRIPGDDVTLYQLAGEILNRPPLIGYLTVSNALQWRLQYGRIVALDEKVEGIVPIIKYQV